MADETLKDTLYHPQVERNNVPARGPFVSEDWDKFSEATVEDIFQLSSKHAGLVVLTERQLEGILREQRFLGRSVAFLKASLRHQERIRGQNGVKIPVWHELYDAAPVSFLDGTPLSLRAQVATTYGQATIPMNGIEPKFYSTSLTTGEIRRNENLTVEVTGTFDKLDGNGLTDWEYTSQQDRLDEGFPNLAFNGNNIDRWVRRIEFPLDSDITEVETQITVRVPRTNNPESNMLSIHPHPLGNIDILGVFTAPDLSDSFTTLSDFSEVLNSRERRWFFPATTIQQVRVRLRQRDWVEENGKKVFYIGAQEIGLYLVDWDKTYVEGGALTDNHSFITKLSAPTGFTFATLHSFQSDPMYTDETDGSRHTHFRITTDDLITDLRWNSDTDALPQTLSTGIDLGNSADIYVFTTLNWVAESGGMSSPFEVNTPPYVNGFGVETTLVSV
jgi:hypothetical protein